MKKKPDRILVSGLLMTILCAVALALTATLPGGGWWFGAQVQNVGSGNATVTFTVYDYATNVSPQTLIDNIGPGSSKTYLNTNFSLPDGFQGSSIINSNQQTRAIVNLTNRFVTVNGITLGDPASTSPAAGQYQGANAAGSPLYFPLVKNDYYSKTTTIIVQNAGTANATASAAFHFPGWDYTYTTPTLKPGQMAAIEPIDAHSGNAHPPTHNSNAYGSLIVSSSQPLAGVALEYYTMEDHATVLQATRGFTSSDFATTVYAPINKNNYYHRFTGLQVQNVSSQSVTLNVTYKATMENANPPNNPLGCSGGTYSDSATVASGSFYTFPSTKLPDNCFASATIVATGGNVVAVVNEAYMKTWLKDHPGHVDEATAYNAIPNGSVSKHLSVPLFKEDSYSKSTGLSIENVGAVKATNVVITLKGPTGTYVSNPISIEPGSAYVAFDLRLKPPAFWNGTALNPTVLGCQNNTTGCGANGVFSVTVTSDQNIVGVANESTYPIDYPLINQDKSNYEAFNLTP
jgi:hypothetical protein